MGAGVLPIAIHDGKIYFLFSREEKNARDGGLWSDFGGRKDNNETYRETAIRECYEEANGILGSKTLQPEIFSIVFPSKLLKMHFLISMST